MQFLQLPCLHWHNIVVQTVKSDLFQEAALPSYLKTPHI